MRFCASRRASASGRRPVHDDRRLPSFNPSVRQKP
jgi:hypothetical protein